MKKVSKGNKLAYFKKFNLWKFLKGSSIYTFKEMYEAKEFLMKYDERTDYCNYGYWISGDKTKNPSAALVEHVVSKLQLKENDILLNIGSGMGQPDIDIVNLFPVGKIIGVNIVAEQVGYANDRFKSLGLNHIIEHRTLNAHDIAEKLDKEGITAVASVEALAEIPDINKVIKNAYEVLSKEGRICFCDTIRGEGKNLSIFKKALGSFLRKVINFMYGGNWRMLDVYTEALDKNGFTNICHEHIGENVFDDLYHHIKSNLHVLKRKKISLPFRILAYLNLYGLKMLFKWKQIDYAVFYAEKNLASGHNEQSPGNA